MTAPAVELREVTVRYGAVTALRQASLSVRRGEIHALVGENGAGKSTLVRALYGLVPTVGGDILVDGERLPRPSPAEAIRRRVGMVHQHFLLVPALTVAENVVLGREPPGLRLDRRAAEAAVAALAAAHDLELDPHRRVAELSVGERQRVEILKALYRGAEIVILDEPTAVLSPPEVARLLAMLGRLRDGGGTAILVTHKLDEVMTIADRVTVLRRGAVVATCDTATTSPGELARLMVGRDLLPPPTSSGQPGEVLLEASALSVAGHHPVGPLSLTVHRGEIFGLAGIEGNGQSELVEALAGLRPLQRGRILLGGREISRLSVAARRRLGLAHVPEDRHLRGLDLELSVAENMLLGRDHLYRRRGLPWAIDRRRLLADTQAMLERFDVRPAAPAASVRTLSGGNQQKLVVARELAESPTLLLAAQPTRGVDLGAVERIHGELDGVRRRGGAVLLVSAELDELFALADRIAVLRRGRLVATLPRREATRERLGDLLTGAERGA